MNDFRNDFPFFSNEKNKDIIYFDNAATSQRPRRVIDAIRHFYEENNANPLRGLYDLSVRATEAYENARHTVARFINAAEDAEVIFTRNASESLNLVAYTYGMANIRKGDEIAVSIMEHHSNILPWQMVAKAKGAKLVYLECDKKRLDACALQIRTRSAHMAGALCRSPEGECGALLPNGYAAHR